MPSCEGCVSRMKLLFCGRSTCREDGGFNVLVECLLFDLEYCLLFVCLFVCVWDWKWKVHFG